MVVTIYTTSTCPWCGVAKQYFKDKEVDFREVNVQHDQEAAREMISKSGQMGVPVIDINGVIIVGFDQSRIDNALNLN